MRIFNDRMEQLAIHVKQEPGRFGTERSHIAAEKISAVERGAAWHLARVSRIGPNSTRWAKAVIEARGVEAVRVLMGLSSLANRYSTAAIERACGIASSYGAFHLRTVLRPDRPGCAEAGNDVIHERASHDPSAIRLRPVRPRRIPTEGESPMNDALRNALKKLRLSGLLESLEIRLQEAAGHGLSHLEFLELILQDELAVRSDRQLQRRVKAALFRELKPLDQFDWAFNPSIKRKQVLDLATCRFVREKRDVLWLGPPGVGKSFLVQAIGYQAIKAGHVVLYRSVFDVVRDFLHDEALSAEDKVLSRYLKPDLLIIDDMGMKQLPKRSGEYLFEIIMRRYETRSTMMTSNRPLEDWGKLLGDVPTATAILDRFLHHAEIVSMNGRSYRLRRPSGHVTRGATGFKTSQSAPRLGGRSIGFKTSQSAPRLEKFPKGHRLSPSRSHRTPEDRSKRRTGNSRRKMKKKADRCLIL